MPRFLYLTVAEAVEMHRHLVQEFGGIQGIRDRGLLEAAIFRPQSGYYDDLVHEAAALMESIASNHPFIDGNKRVSFAVTDTFLRLNGYYVSVEATAISSLPILSERESSGSAVSGHGFLPMCALWKKTDARLQREFMRSGS
jgi:death-on-curing protein